MGYTFLKVRDCPINIPTAQHVAQQRAVNRGFFELNKGLLWTGAPVRPAVDAKTSTSSSILAPRQAGRGDALLAKGLRPWRTSGSAWRGWQARRKAF